MSALKWYHYPRQYEQLLSGTKEHELFILHGDGPYRHLRFQKPGTGIWHWDIITWPGSLAIRGDIGEGFIFTREREMLRLFDRGQPHGHIDAQYWAEKLDRGSRSVREFSNEKFLAWLRKHELLTPGRTALLRDAEEVADTTAEAVAVLDNHDIEWDVDDLEQWLDYEYHFVLALHAILWGAKKYHREAVRAF